MDEVRTRRRSRGSLWLALGIVLCLVPLSWLAGDRLRHDPVLVAHEDGTPPQPLPQAPPAAGEPARRRTGPVDPAGPAALPHEAPQPAVWRPDASASGAQPPPPREPPPAAEQRPSPDDAARAAQLPMAEGRASDGSPARSARSRGGSLNYSDSGSLLALNPVGETNLPTRRVLGMIFEALLEAKPIGVGFRCRLCTDYEIDDGRIRFRLKPGVRWHDGVELSAADVEFSHAAVTLPENRSPHAPCLRELVERVVVEDERTVRFEFRRFGIELEPCLARMPILPAHRFSALKPSLAEQPDRSEPRQVRLDRTVLQGEPDASGAPVASLTVGAVVKVLESRAGWTQVEVIGRGPVGKIGWIAAFAPALDARTGPEFLIEPIGTGPYRFVNQTLNGDCNLERFADYHGVEPSIERIRRKRSTDSRTMVSRLNAEVLDLLPEAPLEGLARIQSSGVARLIAYPSLRIAGFTYNCRHPLLAKREFRRALSLASNRAQWLDRFYQGKGDLIAGPASPDSWLYDSSVQPLPYDLERARELKLASAGAESVRLELIVANDRRAQDLDTIGEYARALESLGVTLHVVSLAPRDFELALREGKFDVAFQELGLRRRWDFRPLFASGGELNHGGYRNAELDELFRAWSTSSDFEQILALIGRSQRLLAEDCPWTFLWSLRSVAAVNNRIRRIGPDTIDPEDFFHWVNRWWIPHELQ